MVRRPCIVSSWNFKKDALIFSSWFIWDPDTFCWIGWFGSISVSGSEEMCWSWLDSESDSEAFGWIRSISEVLCSSESEIKWCSLEVISKEISDSVLSWPPGGSLESLESLELTLFSSSGPVSSSSPSFDPCFLFGFPPPDLLCEEPLTGPSKSAVLEVWERLMITKGVFALGPQSENFNDVTKTNSLKSQTLPLPLNTGRRYDDDSVKRIDEKGENNLPSSDNRGEVASTSMWTKTWICSRNATPDLMRDSSNPARTTYSDFWMLKSSKTLETDAVFFLAWFKACSAPIQQVVPSKHWSRTIKWQLRS